MDLIDVERAVLVLANELGIPTRAAAPLLAVSGITTFNVGLPGKRDRIRLHRADVVAYAAHLAQQAANQPTVRGGPDIGHEADRDYFDGQDDQ